MTILLALLLAAQDDACDQVHGLGCIVRPAACACGKEAVSEGKLCAACAKARKACPMCGRVKRIHAALADVEAADGVIRLVTTADPYAPEIPGIEKSGFKAARREDGRFACAVPEPPESLRPGKKVYVRFVKIDAAGGPPGKFEFALAQRRIRVESVVPLDAGLVVQVKGPVGTLAPGIRVRVVEGGAELESLSYAPGIELRLPPVGADLAVEHVDAAGKTMNRKGPFRFKDGRWTLDGREVASPFLHTGRD